MKRSNVMPAVVVPTGIDPFSRPAGEVTVEEWRVLIASVAGRLRLSQGFSSVRNLPAGADPVLLAENNKSFALFVSGRSLGAAFAYAIGGDPRSATAQSGIVITTSFEQILLPKEKLYATSAVGGSLVVTEVTV